MTAVCDAGPLLLLADLGLFEHLRDLFGQIHMVEDVYNTLLDEATTGFAAAARQETVHAWIKVHNRPPDDVIQAYQVSAALSQTDAAALALAVTINAPYLLSDDDLFRSIAPHFKIKFVGTGALLVHLKHRGIIQSVKHKLEQAQHSGYHIDHATANVLLATAAE